MEENEIRKDERKQIAKRLIDLEVAINTLRLSAFNRVKSKDKINLDDFHSGICLAIDTILDMDGAGEE